MKLLSFEDGQVRLNGTEVPGLFGALSIKGAVRFDEQKVDGQSGKRKIPQGWEDADISLTLYLLTDESGTCYDKVESLSRIFQSQDGKANPQIFTVTNRHLLARSVRQVVFSRLDTTEATGSDEIQASLAFVEHRPPIIKLEEAEAKTPTAKELAETASKKESDAASLEEYIISGELS